LKNKSSYQLFILLFQFYKQFMVLKLMEIIN